MVKRIKRRHEVVRKGKAKNRAGRPRRPDRRRRKPRIDVTAEEEKFTYEGTFTQKDDDL